MLLLIYTQQQLLPSGCPLFRCLLPALLTPLPSLLCFAGGLPIAQLLRYGGQILSALVELHSQGVVMADLKPQNLLLDDDLDELVVTDFGLSRIVSHTVGGYRPSQTAAGTPNYM